MDWGRAFAARASLAGGGRVSGDRGKAVAGLGLGGAAGGRGLGGWVGGEPARAAPRSSVAAAGTRDRALVPEALGGREHTVRSS